MYQDISNIAKDVRAQLKKEFPACKFSVTIDRFSGGQSMTVALMEAPFAVFANLNTSIGYTHNGDYAQLNHMWMRDPGKEYINNGYYLTPKSWKVLAKAIEIANKKNWDRSEIQTDYFDVNYYFDLEIGKWNRPFCQTKLP